MELPAYIYKHWIGHIWISLVGLTAAALLWLGASYLQPFDDDLMWIAIAFTAIILLITVLQLYVYSLSYLAITDTGLKAENWITLFVQQDASTEWGRVQDVSVETGSLFALLFNYGTITIQTAGTNQLIRLSMTPDPEYWAGVINGLAVEADMASV